MQKYIIFTIFIIVIASCGQTPIDSLEEKKVSLKEKNDALALLQKEIAVLKAEIEKLEPRRAKDPLKITTLSVEKSDFKRYIDLQATVATDDIINASSDMGGRIVRLMVKEGQNVKKGQLIATTDAESIDKQREEINKALDLATDVYERQKKLWDQNIGSEVQYLQAKNNKERLEKSLATLKVQSSKRYVYAPISGAVDKVFIKEGELAAPGAPIVQLINVAKVKVVSDVPETYIGKIKVGDKVQLQFPALGKELVQNVSMLGRTIDPSNRTFKMEIMLTNPTGELKPNLLSVVKINDLHIKNVISIPVDNIQQEVSGKKYVYVIKDDGGKKVAQKTYVTTGESAENKIIITDGLSEGDQIILKGARSVLDGQPVIVESL